MSFAPHGQNLSWVLDKDNTPIGFAYRDHEGMQDGPDGYINSYTWFYRYHIFIKLLNVLLKDEVVEGKYRDSLKLPSGAPSQSGEQKCPNERILYPYFLQNIDETEKRILDSVCITMKEYNDLIKELDQRYLEKLRKYFDVDKAMILQPGDVLPAAEKKSLGEIELNICNSNLFSVKKTSVQ